MYPKDYLFTKEHEWIKVEGGEAVLGISEFAQHQLGDIIFVELPAVGKKLDVHSTVGTVESVKSVSDVYAPVSGEVVAVNEQLGQTPDLVNKDPQGQGWIARIKMADKKDLEALMPTSEYEKFLEGLEG